MHFEKIGLLTNAKGKLKREKKWRKSSFRIQKVTLGILEQ